MNSLLLERFERGVTEINCETSSAEVSDLSARFEKGVSVEDLHLVATRAACNDQVASGFLELGSVDLARLARRQLVVHWNLFNKLTSSKVPKLQLSLRSARTCQNVPFVQVE